MPNDKDNLFSERRSLPAGEKRKIKKTLYRGPAQSKEDVVKETPKVKTTNPLTRKDVFVMSFLAFFCAGFVLAALVFAGSAITANAVSFDALDFLGGEEVINQSTEEVDPNSTEEVTEEEVVEEEEVIEEVEEEEEEEIVEVDDDCDETFTISEGSSETIAGKSVELKISSSSAVQVSVGGMIGMIDAGSSEEFGSVTLRVIESSTDEATFRVVC